MCKTLLQTLLRKMLHEHILYKIRKLIGAAFTEKMGEAVLKRIKKTKNLAVSLMESGRRQGGSNLFICLNKLGWLVWLGLLLKKIVCQLVSTVSIDNQGIW